MKALTFEPSIPRYLWTRAVGSVCPLALGGGVRLETRPDPELPGPEWFLVRMRFAGICGSDTAALGYKMSPDMSGLASFPAILGHELVAEVVEAGASTSRARVGDRILVDPFLGCRVRGIASPCPPCEAGFPCVCRNTVAGRFAPGLILGTCQDLPGSWSEYQVVHDSQVYRLSDPVPTEVAALGEPLAIALHAVLVDPPREGERVLIIGGGPIGMAVARALRMIGTSVTVHLLTVLESQRELAERMGVDGAWTQGPETAEALARLVGRREVRGLIGRPYPTGGFDRVYDAVGAPATVRQSLAWTREKGVVVLIGAASRVPDMDLTLLWSKEIRIQGVVGYGLDAHRGRRAHTFEWLMEWLPGHLVGLDSLITHRFPLESFAAALDVAADRSGTSRMKVLFHP